MKRILIVGDNFSIAKAGISAAEYHVELAGTLEEAAQKRRGGDYDQVFVDPDLLARLGMQLLPQAQDAPGVSPITGPDPKPEDPSHSLEAVIDSAPIGICILSGSGLRVERANPAYLQFLEEPHRSGDITGLRPHDFIPRAQESGVVELMERVAHTGETYTNPEYEHLGFERGATYWRYTLQPLPTDQPDAYDVMILASEITEQVFSRKCIEKLAERSVANLAQLQAIMRSMTDGLVVFDLQGNVIDMNLAALCIHGYDTVEQAHRHLTEFPDTFELRYLDGRPIPVEEWPLSRVLKGESFSGLEAEVHRIDTGSVWVGSFGGANVVNADGHVVLGMITIRDVTDQKRSQSEREAIIELLSPGNHPRSFDDLMSTLRDSSERFKLLSETSGQLLLSDAPQQIVNQLCSRVMEYLDCHAFFNFLVDEEHGCLHLNACAGIPEETAREIEWLDYGVAVCGCAARDGCRIVAENIMETPDDRTELVKSFGIQAYACHPLLGQGGKTIGTLSFGTRSRNSFKPDELALMKTVADQVAIAMERIRLLQAEQRRAAELESFISSMADGVIIFDAHGKPIFMNEAGKEIAGVDDDSIGLDGHVFYTLDGELLPDHEKPSMRALRGEYVRDARFRAVSRNREWICSITSSPVKDSQGMIIGATNVFRDQTERVAFERRKQELYEREHHIAEMLQQALIPPQVTYNIPGYRVAVRYQPALREAEVGGDFYDIFELGDGRIGILIGDVAGKGLGAAIRVAAARHSIRSYAYLDASPGVVMTLANEALSKDHFGVTGMLTAFYAVIDTRESTLTYANGGHEPPLLRDSSGNVYELSLGGRALGVMGGYTYNESIRIILPGDTLVMVTDGITEAGTNKAELYGRDGVVDFLQEISDIGPDDIASGLLDAAAAHAGGSLQDDAAIVVLRLEEGVRRSSTVIREYNQEIHDSAIDLPRCRAATLELVASMGFAEHEVGHIVCAVFEACANAVVHGTKGSSVPVSFLIRAYDDRFEAVVKDSGDGFACPVVSPIPPPTAYRGRGIPLMRVYMDDIKIETNGGCQVTLIKYLPGGDGNHKA